ERDAAGVERDVRLAARGARAVVRVAPLGAGAEKAVRRADRSARHAQAAAELLVDEAGEDRRQLREALRRHSDLRAAFDGLRRGQSTWWQWLRRAACAAAAEVSACAHREDEE